VLSCESKNGGFARNDKKNEYFTRNDKKNEYFARNDKARNQTSRKKLDSRLRGNDKWWGKLNSKGSKETLLKNR